MLSLGFRVIQQCFLALAVWANWLCGVMDVALAF